MKQHWRKSGQDVKEAIGCGISFPRLMDLAILLRQDIMPFKTLMRLRHIFMIRSFGSPDDLKLCSSMTLFEQADPDNPVFGEVLDRYYQGKRDQRTLNILKEK